MRLIYFVTCNLGRVGLLRRSVSDIELSNNAAVARSVAAETAFRRLRKCSVIESVCHTTDKIARVLCCRNGSSRGRCVCSREGISLKVSIAACA